MPAKPPITASITADQLIALGQQIRAHRKALRISATTAAEAAGMSRVTLHRIEKGEPAVTMGAYVNAMVALGLNFGLVTSAELVESHHEVSREGWIPARIQHEGLSTAQTARLAGARRRDLIAHGGVADLRTQLATYG